MNSPTPTDRPVALITGGARRIGRAITLALADAHHDAVIHYHRSESAARDTASEAEQRGARAHILPGDLSDDETPARLIDDALAFRGRLEIAEWPESSLS